MKRFSLLLILCAALLFSGCSAKTVDTAALKSMKKVALVSLTLSKVGDGPNNDGVQQTAADYAGEAYLEKLAAVPGWQFVPAPAVEELDRQFADIASSKIADEELMKLAEQNRLPGGFSNALIMQLAIASMTGNQAELERLKGEVLGSTRGELQAELDRARSDLAWPEGVAGIPYSLGGGDGIAEALLGIRHKIIEDYRRRHGLDGVIVIHQATRVGSPGDIRVIVQKNRVLSSLKLNPVIEIYAGGLVYDSGSPRLDDLAPMKLAMPIYTATPGSRGVMENFKLNLDDPKGVSLDGYKKLIDKTSSKRIGKLVKEMQK